ncbi:MAG: family 10 glycosylhydrolase [Ignavibacteriaceae bacterium]
MNYLIRSKISFLLLILFLTSTANAQTNNQEFRSTWVITWEYITSGSTVEQNKARIREILDNHKKANMTSVLFQVRQSGTAYYPSSYEPWGYYAGYTNPGFDPLQYAIEEAHKRGLELHAWFNTFSVSSTHSGTIADQHPDWICRDQDGTPMTAYMAASPGLEAVRNYTLNVAMEIVRNYDIDGLHLDYIRWNEYSTDDMVNASTQLEQETKLDGSFSENTMKKLTSTQSSSRFLYDVDHPYSAGVPAGFSTWEDWWRSSVTEFVKALHDSIQAVKPWVRLSPAALGKYKTGGTSGWNGYYVVYQDAALWFNEGYVDQLTPMHYHWLTGNDLYNAITSDWEPNIQAGIQAGRLYSCGPGSYLLDENNVWSNHAGIVTRMRDKSWADGYQFFSYGSWKDYNYWDEAAQTFFSKKVKVRNIATGIQPADPSISLNKIDSLSYQVTVTPNPAETENSWFAIYRSEDDTLDIRTDVIVNISFGNSAFTYTDSYTGLQDFNGSYKYFATTFNRYWVESAISNSEATDLVPSFAPTVVSTTPAENGELNITSNVIINFSKAMDINSFGNAVSIIPAVTINSLSWSNGNKKLTVSTENFIYNQNYSLTIDPTVTDVNGKLLDGNNDGVAGDSFTLNFHTAVEDNFAPKITYSYPVNNQAGVDVASVVTVVFDEALNVQSLINNVKLLSSDASVVNSKYLHSQTEDGRSIVSVQPATVFNTEESYSLQLGSGISDVLGNNLGTDTLITFTTSGFAYWKTVMIDNFYSPGDWQQPGYSGSTTGILGSGTYWEYTSLIYPPATSPAKSASLSYLWDESASAFLIREYLLGGTPQATYFDTSYVLQTYLYGDGSNNLFRFCIDEHQGSTWGDHEVSKWVTIDWEGWKLVEWHLNDPNSVGIWIGDQTLTGSYFRIDSYQLSKSANGSMSGKIYLDELRAVRKLDGTTGIEEKNYIIPSQFILSQNYPNPFNPATKIKYTIPKTDLVKIKIYDVLGKEIATLVNEEKSAGNYEIEFSGKGLSSGIYFYKIEAGEFVNVKKMILLK